MGCRLSLVKLCDSDFGITPIDDITIRITCTAFCLHIAHISFASSSYLFCLSVIVLARLCVFRAAMSVKKVFFVFLLIKVMSGRLKGNVLSVSMLRFQYLLSSSSSSSSSFTFMQCIYLKQTLFLGYVRSLLRSSLSSSQKGACTSDQAIFIHYYGKNFLTIQHILSFSAFWLRIYRARRKLNSLKLLCNLFG